MIFEIVDPDEFIAMYRRKLQNVKAKSVDRTMPLVWSEGALLAAAVKELRAQLAEAERLLADLGHERVGLTKSPE